MKRITVRTAQPYEVLVGRGITEALPHELEKVLRAKKLMLVGDERTAPLYLAGLRQLLRERYELSSYIFPSGEEYKRPETVLPLLTKLLEQGFDRGDALIALGGGVTGDMTGLSAALYMRGIDYVNIPTTLLAMADSSVGGKTAVDLPGGKNILGAFHQPRLVLCDTEYLDSLPAPVMRDGWAEVIKYAFIDDPELLSMLERGASAPEVLPRCIEDKSRIVSGDERDRGRRGLLNFGHTVAHALERCSGYTVSHGSAVALGMLQMTRACEKAGWCRGGVYERLLRLLREKGLPTAHSCPAEALLRAMRADKKKQGDSLTVVIPTDLCRCELKTLSFGELSDLLKEDMP